MASPSASYQGGLNTITRVFPAGMTGSGNVIGVTPKKGRITRVRFHGNLAEPGLSMFLPIRNPDGTTGGNITTNTDLGAAFTSPTAAFAGVDAELQNQDLLNALAYQVILATVTGTSVGEIAVIVQFEPR